MAKTFSFAAVHFTVAFGVGYAMTGDARVGGALALVEPLCNTIAFHLHERVWARRAQRAGTRDSGLEIRKGGGRTGPENRPVGDQCTLPWTRTQSRPARLAS